MTDKANSSEKVLTNDDLNALAVRLIAGTSRFQFGADGSYKQLVQHDEIRPFARTLTRWRPTWPSQPNAFGHWRGSCARK